MKKTDPLPLSVVLHPDAMSDVCGVRLRPRPPAARRPPDRAFRRCKSRMRSPLAAALLLCIGGAVSATAPLALAQAPEAAAMEQVQQVRDDGVNINTASADELAERLSGVGGSKALAIVRYREQFGPFESVEELTEVAGIGMATIERNRALLRVR